MFDLDLAEQTNTELLLINWTANIIPNSEIISVKGKKEIIYDWLSNGRFLEKVNLDFSHVKIQVFTDINGIKYIGEIVPIKTGGESLVYHGSSRPSFDKTILFSFDKKGNSIRIFRRLSTSSDDNLNCYKNYFNSINDFINQMVMDLNISIEEHNVMVDKCCKQFAEYYEELFQNNPEFLGAKR